LDEGRKVSDISEADAALVDRIAEAVHRLAAQQMPIPLSVDLWDIAMVARYLKRDEDTVRRRIVSLADFPKPLRIPSANGRGHPLYKAVEVIAWAESLRDAKPGRPRGS
jgi:hypothetical protein